ncbi:MAG: SRPBCC family protein [Acidobacteriota bacterium]
MPLIRIETPIRASMEVCFDLARNIDLHVESMKDTGERAVAGVTSGAINLGEEVTWEATHFGVRQRLTSRITAFDRPHRFRDSQVRGAFRRFDHDHIFESTGAVTIMIDLFDYQAPFGLFGRLADALFLERYMQRLLRTRAAVIQAAAESHRLIR